MTPRDPFEFDLETVSVDGALLDLLAAGDDLADPAVVLDDVDAALFELLSGLRAEARVDDPTGRAVHLAAPVHVQVVEPARGQWASVSALAARSPLTPQPAAPAPPRRGGRRTTAALLAAGAVLSVGGVAAAVTGDPIAPIRAIVDLVRGETPGREAAEALEDAAIAVRAGDYADARQLIAEAKARLAELDAAERARVERQIAALERRLAAKDRAALPGGGVSVDRPLATDPTDPVDGGSTTTDPAGGGSGSTGADNAKDDDKGKSGEKGKGDPTTAQTKAEDGRSAAAEPPTGPQSDAGDTDGTDGTGDDAGTEAGDEGDEQTDPDGRGRPSLPAQVPVGSLPDLDGSASG